MKTTLAQLWIFVLMVVSIMFIAEQLKFMLGSWWPWPFDFVIAGTIVILTGLCIRRFKDDVVENIDGIIIRPLAFAPIAQDLCFKVTGRLPDGSITIVCWKPKEKGDNKMYFHFQYESKIVLGEEGMCQIDREMHKGVGPTFEFRRIKIL